MKFLGNEETKVVCNTENEKPECKLGEIVKKKTFEPDTLWQAWAEQYIACEHCMGVPKKPK